MKPLFDGIYTDGKFIYTKNLLPGKKVYGEKLVNEQRVEYRTWDANRSKYAAAIKNGLTKNIFQNGESVLYLGSAEGTTISHVSDITGQNGIIYGVDLSEIAMMKLIKLAEERTNIFPILSDAQNTQNYAKTITETSGKVDTLFMDISQRNQADIFIRNSHFLKQHHYGALVIKIKSISQSKGKEEVLAEEKKTLMQDFEIIQVVNLEPYEKHHYLILVKKK